MVQENKQYGKDNGVDGNAVLELLTRNGIQTSTLVVTGEKGEVIRLLVYK
jgi:hypothetical protein